MCGVDWGSVGEWVAGLATLAAVLLAWRTARDAKREASAATEALGLVLKPDVLVGPGWSDTDDGGTDFVVECLVTGQQAALEVEFEIELVSGERVVRTMPLISPGRSSGHLSITLASMATRDHLGYPPLTDYIRSASVTFSDARRAFRWRRRFEIASGDLLRLGVDDRL